MLAPPAGGGSETMAQPAAHPVLEGEARRLATYVLRMERRYERPSAEMLEAVRCGEARETRDVRKWLDAYAALGEAWPEGANAALDAFEDELAEIPPRRRRWPGRGGKIRIVQVTLEGEISKYSARVRRRERRYECSSEEMLEAVRSGRAKETWDICEWLIDYRCLKDLLKGAGREAGSLGSATASSTKIASSP